ncbi:MAG: glycosyltransferase [Xanthobacteraceae bacterium]|nr:glycosyltransferase [Xanthobacteraceae bacterium]
MRKPVVAIFSHSHPFYSKGGGEVVAYNSFQSMLQAGQDVHLYSAINTKSKPNLSIFHPGEFLLPYAERQYLFAVHGLEGFTFTHENRSFFPQLLALLKSQKVDVFHFHHFWNVGVDTICYLMSAFPEAKFVITLHEFLAICHRDGQMTKTGNNALCTRASDIDCHICFPEIDKHAFRARRRLFNQFLSRFDLITAPSEFLASRFVEWGLTKDIYVLENGYERPAGEDERTLSPALTTRFAFFGQPTRFKGVDIFVAAAQRAVANGPSDSSFAIYGCDQEQFLQQFGEHWKPALEQLGARLQFMGMYEPSQVCQLMRQNGWIVVPSIWWENSPLVIQEAFLAGRPPIVADIGGMREKVKHGVTGLHFLARNIASLAETFVTASGDMGLWTRLRAARALPPTMAEMNNYFLQLYETVKKPSGAQDIVDAAAEPVPQDSPRQDSPKQDSPRQTAPKKETSKRAASRKEAKAAV